MHCLRQHLNSDRSLNGDFAVARLIEAGLKVVVIRSRQVDGSIPKVTREAVVPLGTWACLRSTSSRCLMKVVQRSWQSVADVVSQ